MATTTPAENSSSISSSGGGNSETLASTPSTTVAVATVATAAVGSKRAAKRASKKRQEEQALEAATVDHPYLSFLYKRIRLYKKKLEKIKALALAQETEGKVLNEQQLEVLANRGLVEKMLAEFEALRVQFIEVYVAEEATKRQQEEEKQQEQEQQQQSPASEEPVTTVIVTEVESVDPPVVLEPAAAADVSTTNEPQRLVAVEDLLRTLHAVTLHQALGHDVPMALDYFSKVLLGKTRPPAEVEFEENLAESLEEARRYLAGSDKVMVCDLSYRDLRAMVENLGKTAQAQVTEPLSPMKHAGASEGEVSEEGEEEMDATHNVAVEVAAAPLAQDLPDINFFTDAILEVAKKKNTEKAVESDEKVTDHDYLPEAIESPASDDADEESPEDDADVVPVAVPPKSFAAAAATMPSANVWSRPPAAVLQADSSNSPRSGDDKPRRRTQGRAKGNGSNEGDLKGTFTKPRRTRPPRSNDENSNAFNANRSAGKFDNERRSRGDKPFRKPTLRPQAQQQNQADVTAA